MRNQIVATLLIGFMLSGTSASTAQLLSGENPEAKMPATAAQSDSSNSVYVAQRQSSSSLEGSWTISEGKNPDGSKYTGTVEIKPTGDLYSVSWDTSGASQSGIGFLEDDHLFVGWGMEDQIYGVALYRINKDGTMEGKWTFLGADGEIGTETATGGKRDKVEGEYQVSGTDKGGTYTGTLDISKSGDTYEIAWTVDNKTYRGVGLRSDDWLVVGWGPQNGFGVMDYKIKGTKATGRWALLGESDLGSEKIDRSQGNSSNR